MEASPKGFNDGAFVVYGINYIFSFIDINLMIHEFYGAMIEGFQCFGCDIFANQFAFKDGLVFTINIETGDTKYVADSFKSFWELVYTDYDLITGRSIMNAWEDKYSTIEMGNRLTPKIPFVIGGEYSPENIYQSEIKSILGFNASLAKQIRDLPDGTPVQLEVVD